MHACKVHQTGAASVHAQNQQNTVKHGAKTWCVAVPNHVEQVRLMKQHATGSEEKENAYIQTKHNAPAVNINIEHIMYKYIYIYIILINRGLSLLYIARCFITVDCADNEIKEVTSCNECADRRAGPRQMQESCRGNCYWNTDLRSPNKCEERGEHNSFF